MSSVQDQWIESHPYLRNVEEFQQTVTDVFAKLEPQPVSKPNWKTVFEAYSDGLPLLESLPADLGYSSAAGEVLLAGNVELLNRPLTEAVTASARSLREYLQASEANRVTAVEWVQNGESEAAPPAAGLLRVLAWAAIRRTIAPVLKSYSELRKDEEW